VRYAELACRLCLLTVFAVALAGKLSGRDAFAAFTRSLRQMSVVPQGTVALAARASIAAEALVVVLLAIPVRGAGTAGFAVAAGLLAVFTGAIVSSLRRGNVAPCRCFGASSTPLGRRHVLRNAALIAVALLGFVAALVPGTAGISGLLVAGAAGVVAGVTVTAFDDIVALVRPVSGATPPTVPSPPRRSPR
jgi:ABC-type microcin C transport system permease subunit YejB